MATQTKFKRSVDKNEEICRKIEGEEGRDYPVIQGVVGGFLHMRNLFGLKGLFATMCKDPDLVH